MPAYVKLLRDSEAEVRVAAAGKVATFCKLLSNDQVVPPPLVPPVAYSPMQRWDCWTEGEWSWHVGVVPALLCETMHTSR